jgi:hypothetical protein
MSRRNKTRRDPPPIAPPPMRPWRRVLRRFLFLLAFLVILGGPILIARSQNHEAKVRILNQSSRPVSDVELVWNGGKESWKEIAPGSSGEIVIPEQGVQSIRLRFAAPDGGLNRLIHTGKPPDKLARLILSRRTDFQIREDPLRPGFLTATISEPRNVNLRELLGLED